MKILTLLRHFYRLNFTGLAIGVGFYCLALTPSLLPRPAMFKGLVAGVSFAMGYGVGVLVSWLVRHGVRRELPHKVKLVAWYSLFVAGIVLVIAYGIWSATWQNQVRSYIGEPLEQGRHSFTIIFVALAIASVVISVGRLIAWGVREISKISRRWVPVELSRVIGIVVVTALLVLFYNGVIVKTFVHVTNSMYRGRNDKTNPGAVQPVSSLRSGGPGSLAPWKTLGRQGRSFVSGGPNQKKLTDLAGTENVKEPIRVYAGLESARDAQARAQLAVKELERTGAFDRSILVVMTTTGTGWIEPQAADSLEYMWQGDSAEVAIQYSYLPSWISFLVDRQNAGEAGRALFKAVYDRWRQLPQDHRPKLVVYGLSLGSYGAQASFSGADDLQNRTNGALFVGSPNNSQPWGYFTDHRDQGSPQWQPVYQKGQTIRFAAYRDDIFKPKSAWQYPRTLYLQHASDPIVWWSPNLIWHKPAWLSEKRGSDVNPNMQWYPFVTFAQVTVDEFFGVTAPVGHGHNYSNAEPAAWRAVTNPPNFTDQQAEKLQNIIMKYKLE